MDYLIDFDIILQAHNFLMKNEENKGLVNKANLEYAIYDCQKPKYEILILKAIALMFNIINIKTKKVYKCYEKNKFAKKIE